MDEGYSSRLAYSGDRALEMGPRRHLQPPGGRMAISWKMALILELLRIKVLHDVCSCLREFPVQSGIDRGGEDYISRLRSPKHSNATLGTRKKRGPM